MKSSPQSASVCSAELRSSGSAASWLSFRMTLVSFRVMMSPWGRVVVVQLTIEGWGVNIGVRALKSQALCPQIRLKEKEVTLNLSGLHLRSDQLCRFWPTSPCHCCSNTQCLHGQIVQLRTSGHYGPWNESCTNFSNSISGEPKSVLKALTLGPWPEKWSWNNHELNI